MIYDVYFVFTTLQNGYTLIWFNKSHTDSHPCFQSASPPEGRTTTGVSVPRPSHTRVKVAQERFQEGGSLGQILRELFVLLNTAKLPPD